MNLLLDTHTLLWALTDPERLGPQARPAIEKPDNHIRASAVSAWEIAVKQQIGKLRLPAPAMQWLPSAIQATGIEWMNITPLHALRVGTLPPHHQDPFDRLLVAQALDGFILVTKDAHIPKYDIATLW